MLAAPLRRRISMGWLRRSLFFLGALIVIFLGGCSVSSSHFLHNLYMVVSEPGQELPQVVAVGYVDGRLYIKYDRDTGQALPQVPWMGEIQMADPHYWDGQAQIARNTEPAFKVNLETLRNRYNYSHGAFHILQGIVSCELSQDGKPIGGRYQYVYDGRDFLAFDKETLTWTASVPQAEFSKRKLDPLLATSQYLKSYLEEECVDWLQKHLKYGRESLLRTGRAFPNLGAITEKAFHDIRVTQTNAAISTEPLVARVTLRADPNGQETLFCQVYGFYPKEIDITWKKDGEAWQQDMFTRGVAPNSDGTFHTTLSIDIDPKERGCFRCHVEHDGLPEPPDLSWEEPASNVGLIVGVLVGVLAAALLGAGVLFYIRKQRENGYNTTSTNDPGPERSTRDV